MGGGDLNLKKSWHTGTLKNMERVWKLEQQQLEEKKRAQQLKTELNRENQVQELRRLQQNALGGPQRPGRMDWMYAGTAGADSVASYNDEFLLGKKSLSVLLDAKTDSDLASRDMESKLREDPLLKVKKKELEWARAKLQNRQS